jgi:hypothetical protein
MEFFWGKLFFTWQNSLYSSTSPPIEPEHMAAWPLREKDAVAAKARLLRDAWESLEQPDRLTRAVAAVIC